MGPCQAEGGRQKQVKGPGRTVQGTPVPSPGDWYHFAPEKWINKGYSHRRQ